MDVFLIFIQNIIDIDFIIPLVVQSVLVCPFCLIYKYYFQLIYIKFQRLFKELVDNGKKNE